MQCRHYEYAREREDFPSLHFDLPSLTCELIDGEPELFTGVQVVLTPGHAPWHQSLLITLPNDGNILMCADAIDCRAQPRRRHLGAPLARSGGGKGEPERAGPARRAPAGPALLRPRRGPVAGAPPVAELLLLTKGPRRCRLNWGCRSLIGTPPPGPAMRPPDTTPAMT